LSPVGLERQAILRLLSTGSAENRITVSVPGSGCPDTRDRGMVIGACNE